VAKVKTPVLFSLNFAPKMLPFMTWKIMVQPDWPQMKMYYGACALHAG
jgi:hypothetical protein